MSEWWQGFCWGAGSVVVGVIALSILFVIAFVIYIWNTWGDWAP